MKVGLVVPHIFMQASILPRVIFSPGKLALELAQGLETLGANVTLFTPGPVTTPANNITADLNYFEQELTLRGDDYLDLLKKHPLTFITLARQVQSELIAKAYRLANEGQFDLIHVYTNEEDIALPFATFCTKPVVFTHHDPFNFLVKYKNLFPKYKHLNWVSMSHAQRASMPKDTNWVGNIYHGLDVNTFTSIEKPESDYLAYLGRIIEPKGMHLAIQAVKEYNASSPARPYRLKIAGKHYAGTKDTYWRDQVEPLVDGKEIEYVGFIKATEEKQQFLSNAAALVVPSTFHEPFGMVMIEALACGTPVIGLNSGAIPEVIKDGVSGIIVPKITITGEKSVVQPAPLDEAATAHALTTAIEHISTIERAACRQEFEERFTLERMCQEHLEIYKKLITAQPAAL